MKHIQLKAAGAVGLDDNIILLVEKKRIDHLHRFLNTAEFAFLQAAVERDVKICFFPRTEGSVIVRVFPDNKQGDEAIEEARLAGNDILREIKQYRLRSVTVSDHGILPRALPFSEGMALGSYQFLKYFSKPEKKENTLAEIRVDADAEQVEELNALLEAVFFTRSMVNEPHSHFDALSLAEAAVSAGQTYGFGVEILGKEKIESLKMGGLLAINKASVVPPQFCVLEWMPPGAVNEKPVVLVGKGVVYDTGGLSLKPSDAMDYMKCDMAGAAAVIGTFCAVAANKLPVKLVGLIPATDNKIGEQAISPGDVITMYSGKTVEVVNTDAEGRIILADALHYAKKYQPELVIDLATLTGAAVRALGTQAICYMGNASESVKKDLEKSGWVTYERLVELPLWKEFSDELKSNIADLRNVGMGNAGMITAAKFLEYFIDYPWLHLDIAGPAYLRSANGYRTKEGTGVGVRLLYHFLKKRSGI